MGVNRLFRLHCAALCVCCAVLCVENVALTSSLSSPRISSPRLPSHLQQIRDSQNDRRVEPTDKIILRAQVRIVIYVVTMCCYYVLLCVLYLCVIPCYIVNGYTIWCICCVCCYVFYVLTPPSLPSRLPLLSLHAQVPNTLDVLSEEDFMMTQPRLVPSTYSSTRYTRYTQRALHGVYTPRNDPE